MTITQLYYNIALAFVSDNKMKFRLEHYGCVHVYDYEM